MSVTLTVLDKTPQRLRIQVDNPSGNNIARIVRAVPGRPTRAVRLEEGMVPTTSGLVFLDYEYPLMYGAKIVYTVYSTTNAVLGFLSVAAPFDNASQGHAFLTVPRHPVAGIELASPTAIAHDTVVTRWDDTRESRATVHYIVGRADPIIVQAPVSIRTGGLQIVCPTAWHAQRLETTLAMVDVFMLRQSDVDNLDLYFVVNSIAVSHADVDFLREPNGLRHRRWTVAVTWTEVAWPTGYVVPISVWRYNDVAAGYGDYNAVAAAFGTYADLLIRAPS